MSGKRDFVTNLSKSCNGRIIISSAHENGFPTDEQPAGGGQLIKINNTTKSGNAIIGVIVQTLASNKQARSRRSGFSNGRVVPSRNINTIMFDKPFLIPSTSTSA